LRWSRPFYIGNNLINLIQQFKKAKTAFAKVKDIHDIIFYIYIILADLNDMLGWLATVKHIAIYCIISNKISLMDSSLLMFVFLLILRWDL